MGTRFWILLLLAGCAVEATARRQVAVDGGTLESADRIVRLTFPSGARSTPTEISITNLGPADLDGLVGDAYELGPSGLLFDAPVEISFESPGEDLAIAFFGAGRAVPLETRREGDRLIAELAHFTTVGLVRSAPLAEREDVADLLANGYVHALFTPLVLITGPDAPAPAGTVIAESYGASYELAAPTWFFWVDLFPTASFAHPSLLVFVDPATGRFTEHRAEWEVLIDGAAFLPDARERFASPLTVYRPPQDQLDDPIAFPAMQSREVDGFETALRALNADGMPVECEGERALVVDGTTGEKPLALAGVEMDAYLRGPAGFDSVTKYGFEYGSDLVAAIKRDLVREKDQPCWCEVFVYLVAHGNDSQIGFRDGNNESRPNSSLTHEGLVSALGEVCAVKKTLVLESCEAGAIIDDLTAARDEARVNPRKAAAGGPDLCTGELDVVAASVAGRSTFQYDIGLEALTPEFVSVKPALFTRVYLEQLNALAADGKPRDFGLAGARVEKLAELSQGPTLLNYAQPQAEHFSNASANCECKCCDPTNVPPPPPEDPNALDVGVDVLEMSFEHEGFSQLRGGMCPRRLQRQVTVTNREDQAVDVLVLPTHNLLLIDPPTFQLAPGASQAFAVSIDCAARASFDARIQIDASLPDGSRRQFIEIPFSYVSTRDRSGAAFITSTGQLTFTQPAWTPDNPNNCNRKLATLRVENVDDEPLAFSVSTPSIQIRLDGALDFTLAPDTVGEFDLYLTCADPTSFTTTVDISATGQTSGAVSTDAITIIGNIQ